jgi:hypothetical protein
MTVNPRIVQVVFITIGICSIASLVWMAWIYRKTIMDWLLCSCFVSHPRYDQVPPPPGVTEIIISTQVVSQNNFPQQYQNYGATPNETPPPYKEYV